MSTTRRDSGNSIRASLVSFFRSASPPANACEDDPSPLPYTYTLSPTPKLGYVLPSMVEDEESNCGFSVARNVFQEKVSHDQMHVLEDEHLNDEERSLYNLCGPHPAIVMCIMGCFGTFFVLGLFANQFHLGIGSPAWPIFGLGQGTSTDVEMQFCLTSPNLEAPAPQMWTYIVPGSQRVCSTETITLSVKEGEAWKMRVDDQIAIEHRESHEKPKESEKFVQFAAYRKIESGDASEGQSDHWTRVEE